MSASCDRVSILDCRLDRQFPKPRRISMPNRAFHVRSDVFNVVQLALQRGKRQSRGKRRRKGLPRRVVTLASRIKRLQLWPTDFPARPAAASCPQFAGGTPNPKWRCGVFSTRVDCGIVSMRGSSRDGPISCCGAFKPWFLFMDASGTAIRVAKMRSCPRPIVHSGEPSSQRTCGETPLLRLH